MSLRKACFALTGRQDPPPFTIIGRTRRGLKGIVMGLLWDRYGTPMGSLWDSYGTPMGLLWDSYNFPSDLVSYTLVGTILGTPRDS